MTEIFQNAQKLVKEAKTLRHGGSVEKCKRKLSKAINKLNEIPKKAKLTSHMLLLSEAYCLRAFCISETEPSSQVKPFVFLHKIRE